ncbi:hypothetical protein VSH64_47430 [Amycolatopsis rhabdoformis]|uniref:Uncharacterized protein n=1 Tax=Amycolatopsis rhabdoformis TaxID=1448059 RepID=A0ABZ1I9D5_9PSEU|nr:hypothetical protein [Amycolatopsis rhabdoformis]WSE30341.1 hypothetical protein VSH64_47430 [Amycolatopsis rhabdoformis]
MRTSEEDETGGELGGSPLLLEPPPPLLLGGVSEDGGLDGSLGGEVGSVGLVGDEGGGSLRGVVDGLTGLPPVGWPPGPPGWFGCPGGLFGGGGITTVVVGTPSAPVETTVVGVAGVDGVPPAEGWPGTVMGAPGTALPGTTCELPGRVPWPPPGMLGGVAVVLPGPASSATAAKAVATTRPLTPRMA